MLMISDAQRAAVSLCAVERATAGVAVTVVWLTASIDGQSEPILLCRSTIVTFGSAELSRHVEVLTRSTRAPTMNEPFVIILTARDSVRDDDLLPWTAFVAAGFPGEDLVRLFVGSTTIPRQTSPVRVNKIC